MPAARSYHGRAGKLKGSISTRLAATAAAAVVGSAIGIRRGDLISWYRHRVDAADQLIGLRVQRCGQVAVLVGLRSRQLERLILGLQRIDLGLYHEVHQAAIVRVLVVDNITGRVLDRVAGVASLRRHVIAHALDRVLGLAAAVLQVVAELAQGLVHTVKALQHRNIGAVKAAGNRIVQCIDRIANALLDCGNAAFQAVECNRLVYISAGRNALQARISGRAAAEAAEAKAAAAPAENHSKEDNGPPAITAPHAASRIIIAVLA